jgi:hypothetical protein
VSNLTDPAAEIAFNGAHRVERHRPANDKDRPMLVSIVVTLLVVGALALGLRSGRKRGLILSRPYNNRYNDASGAREDHLE